MHKITVAVTFLQLKYSFNDFKEEFINRIRERFKKKKKKILRKAIIFGGRACFGWVGGSTANQHFFKVGLSHSPYKTSVHL